MNENLEKAYTVLVNGGIVIFPTDTAFGIGCRMDDPKAVRKIFSIRRRPETQATPVLVSGREMACGYYDSPTPLVLRLMDTYWPGALTIVAPARSERIDPLVRGGQDTIGMRMPDAPDLCSIIDRLGVPVLGPSANIHGDPTPYRRADLNPELVAVADYILDGVCTVKKASTVVSCNRDSFTVLRNGAITIARFA